MDLDSIYAFAKAVNKLADDGGIRYEDIDNAITIHIKVNPIRHFGIDKELYRRTHEGVDEGFVHSTQPIEAMIDGIKFIIEQDGV